MGSQRDVGHELAAGRRVFLVAPAGYGKTHSIALAVKVAADLSGRQLILTHTHAGVSALQAKLDKLGVPRPAWNVETIAGWSLKYAAAFRKISGITEQPTGKSWDVTYPAAAACLAIPAIRDVLTATYGGVFVDEYQDCTAAQHGLVLRIAELLPCRLLGDPMQGIFEFAGATVDMEGGLDGFTPLQPLDVPYRWLNAGRPDLGVWLAQARETILKGGNLALGAEVTVVGTEQGALQAHAKDLIGAGGSVVVAYQFAAQAHSFAKGVGGRYKSMEEMDCGDLAAFAAALDSGTPVEQAIALIDHELEMTSNVSSALNPMSEAIKSGNFNPSRYRSNKRVAESLAAVAAGGGPDALGHAHAAIGSMEDATIYRRELSRETGRTFLAMASGKFGTFAEAAIGIRERTRRLGRRPERLSSSRILLIKGLEFDHAIVPNAASLGPKELYVALTRGAVSLSVQSASAFVSPKAAKVITPAVVRTKRSTSAGQSTLFDDLDPE